MSHADFFFYACFVSDKEVTLTQNAEITQQRKTPNVSSNAACGGGDLSKYTPLSDQQAVL